MVAVLDTLGSAIGTAAGATWRALKGVPDRKEEALGALNGLVGDVLHEQGHALAVPFRLRPVGEPTPKLVVLIHGLMSSDARWALKDRDGDTFGSVLASERGVTPVYVTYNSGRHISDNGKELAKRLQSLVDGWPVPVTEVNLVGHSMGGLVARSACHYAVAGDLPWVSRVRRLFLLGTPNRGATMEQLAFHVTSVLHALPVGVVQALGRLVDRRSAGIKDLRRGSIVEEDWRLSRRHEAFLPDGVEVFVACGNLVGEGEHAVAKVLGDVLVSQHSARGRRLRGTGALCDDERVAVFSGTGHLGLSSSPDVCRQVLAWWDAGGEPGTPAELSDCV